MGEIKIEKNIPLPEPRSKWKDLLLKMKVGDSFLTVDSNRSNISATAKKMGFKVVSRMARSKIRIWLVKK